MILKLFNNAFPKV